MQWQHFLIIMTLISMFGCTKNNTTSPNIDGTYNGTFSRNGNTSNVMLTLNNGTFNGQSVLERFPALCAGTYEITENIITFSDSCMWTTEFDWSLILNGNWNFSYDNELLIMTNVNGDEYVLTK